MLQLRKELLHDLASILKNSELQSVLIFSIFSLFVTLFRLFSLFCFFFFLFSALVSDYLNGTHFDGVS